MAATTQQRDIRKKVSVELDQLLTPGEAALWLGLSQRVLLANVRRKKIPAVRINDRVLRFHPRSILRAGGITGLT
jgi:hypothetical protein